MPTDNHDFGEIPLLVSCTNGGGLVLLQKGSALVLDSRDHTGLEWQAGRYTRAIISHSRCQLEWRCEGQDTQRLMCDAADDIHDILWHDNTLYAVITGTNEILRLSADGASYQRQRFPGEGDAWHLNCLAVWDGRVVASAFGEFSTHRGYKGKTRAAGFVFDLVSGAKLWTGLSQPHSPLQEGDKLYVCDSESHRVLWRRGNEDGALQFEAYTRGLAVQGEYLFVGLSQSRNTDNTGANGAIAVLETDGYRRIATLPVPFREVYAISPLADLAWPMLFALGVAERDDLRDQLAGCQESLKRAEASVTALDRLQRHPLTGGLIEVLRKIKRDPGFGRAAD